jgi:hypothetical protein
MFAKRTVNEQMVGTLECSIVSCSSSRNERVINRFDEADEMVDIRVDNNKDYQQKSQNH